MLLIEQGQLVFTGPSPREAGTVRYSPSFAVSVQQIALVGYAPRLIADDESGFIVLADRQGRIHYINLDLLTRAEAQQLAETFGYDLARDTPDHSYEAYRRGLSVVLYPATVRGRRLLKPWSWFAPRGFLKNLGYRLGMDKPMWERLTDEMQNYGAQG